MPQLIIKYKSKKTLEILNSLAEYLNFVVEPCIEPNVKKNAKKSDLPIQFAEKPDVLALAGIWKGRTITLEELRKDAWGDRL